MSQEEIRNKGLKALLEALGPTDMLKFLEQFVVGKGNYTKERHQWLDKVTLETIIEDVETYTEMKNKDI